MITSSPAAAFAPFHCSGNSQGQHPFTLHQTEIPHCLHRPFTCSAASACFSALFSHDNARLSPAWLQSSDYKNNDADPLPIASWHDATYNNEAYTDKPLFDDERDAIMEKLCSPAPQSFGVINRAVRARAAATTNKASLRHDIFADDDAIQNDLWSLSYLVKPGYRVTATKDVTKKNDQKLSRVRWSIVPDEEEEESKTFRSGRVRDGSASNEYTVTVLDLAHRALDLVSTASEKGVPVNNIELDIIVDQAEDRLVLTQGTDLRGRKASDAAFCFALAGVDRRRLFDALAFITAEELSRCGKRSSCKVKDILQIVEKLAASGATGSEVNKAYSVAARCLKLKGYDDSVAKILSSHQFGLHMERPLLWLWRFSAKQRKPPMPETDTYMSAPYTVPEGRALDWTELFDDPTKNLVIDVGCGMGVSLLGLASIENGFTFTNASALELDWPRCNYLGADLSHLFIGYATSVALRWGLGGKVHFIATPAERLLHDVISYPGSVKLIMLQFPTPFRLNQGNTPIESENGNSRTSRKGNSQLPLDGLRGFMASEALLRTAFEVLQPGEGKLLLQSNCEDIAVWMRAVAVNEAGFVCDRVPSPVSSRRNVTSWEPLRTSDWIRIGGERAQGFGWSNGPLLPARGATETEISCLLRGTPVHRCVLSPP